MVCFFREVVIAGMKKTFNAGLYHKPVSFSFMDFYQFPKFFSCKLLYEFISFTIIHNQEKRL